MHVIATAGHVDHGKSTLLRALTGMEPDRWAEERRRGMTIDLGFAWTTLGPGATVAFVDVPGHERFIGNMLAGIGPAPAVMFVVAADEGWMPQSAEHLTALDALGVRQGILVISRCDLAEPASALVGARRQLAMTSLGGIESVCVSATTGTGMDDLRAALSRLVATLPPPEPDSAVRLWVDRAFTIRGAGTVVTGTLTAGAISTGDSFRIAPGEHAVRVRGVESLKAAAFSVHAVARVAVNLRHLPVSQVRRGSALLTPDAWDTTTALDVRSSGPLPPQVLVHVGSAAVPARVRPFDADLARLTLGTPLPLRIGDRLLLRDPGSRRIIGATVLDVRPPDLVRRGSGALRRAELTAMTGQPDAVSELRRRHLVTVADLRRMGCPAPSGIAPVAGDWLLDPAYRDLLRTRLATEVESYLTAHPLEPGLPVEAARQLLGLPDRRLVEALVTPPLVANGGRVLPAANRDALPPDVAAAVETLRDDLAKSPFAAPDAGRLAALGLTPARLAAAVRIGSLLPIGDGVYLTPESVDLAVQRLAELPQPFTVSDARSALATTRRVAVPLLELLDRANLTRRVDEVHRLVADRSPTDRPAGAR
ncbi:selenocysteine-specific translation elongation factor [Kribbella capetownensis]|uniref:Selenocysteine-specific translation elongation factor n=1 Tax=Kribbella capetownensis TaxID=1572659 RepID=A0A4R0JV65_9ACTN|nr:selenocysteine-specific translation elongation factor [Kribbella capetownensis]TCC49078.1 selenocysteine-specific translation elongation factor [Kribbella capetownensis]